MYVFTCFCICSHLWFQWFLTTIPLENSFFTGLTASLLTHFVLVFSTSFQVSFLICFSQLLKLFRCPFCSNKQEKTARGKAWYCWLRKKSRRNCFYNFWTIFGFIFGSLLLDFGVPFFIVFYGGGREAFRHRLVPFWSYFGVMFKLFCCFCWMQFEFVWPRADSWSLKQKRKKNAVILSKEARCFGVFWFGRGPPPRSNMNI